MSIDDLLKSTVGVSCGLCCNDNVPCNKCLESTLRANGIDLNDIEQFRGLKNKAMGYQYPFEFSELSLALKKYKQNRSALAVV